jgi:hypothetical protein
MSRPTRIACLQIGDLRIELTVATLSSLKSAGGFYRCCDDFGDLLCGQHRVLQDELDPNRSFI